MKEKNHKYAQCFYACLQHALHVSTIRQTHSHARMPSKDAGVIDEAQQLVPSEEPVDDGTTVDEVN